MDISITEAKAPLNQTCDGHRADGVQERNPILGNPEEHRSTPEPDYRRQLPYLYM